MTAAIDWLRGELADDREQLASMGAADYLRAGLDTLLAPGLVCRGMVHACVYAINHAEPGAVMNWSLFERPLRADCWRARDDFQAAVLSALSVGVLGTSFASLPNDPVLATVVGLQTLPLLADPAAAIVEVAG